MLWIQGESDALTEQDAAAYPAQLSKFVSTVRTDLKAHHVQLPILLGIMSTRNRQKQFPHIKKVRQAQLEFRAEGVIKSDMEVSIIKACLLARQRARSIQPKVFRIRKMRSPFPVLSMRLASHRTSSISGRTWAGASSGPTYPRRDSVTSAGPWRPVGWHSIPSMPAPAVYPSLSPTDISKQKAPLRMALWESCRMNKLLTRPQFIETY
jgi:hypothetical protein